MPSPAKISATPLAEDAAKGATALLIIDMISDWAAPGMAPLRQAAHAMAPCLARLKARCREAGVPAIYVNDNLGRWRSDFNSLVDAARDQGGQAAEIATLLAPREDDYFVLKPKHSAFFATPLDLLLKHLKAHRLIIAGVSADQCILASVMDALMRDYEVQVVTDCVAAPSETRTAGALRHFEDIMNIPVTACTDLRLPSSTP